MGVLVQPRKGSGTDFGDMGLTKKFSVTKKNSKVFSMVSLNITKGGLYLQNQFQTLSWAEPRPPMDWSDLEFEPLIMV